MQKHLNIHVFGQVQGVVFRFSASEVAQNLGVRGFVKNLEDGSVYIEVEGQENNLNEFISWCKKGPPFAKVKKIEVKEGNIKNFSIFEIK